MISLSLTPVQVEEKTFNISSSQMNDSKVYGWTLFNTLVKFNKSLRIHFQDKILNLEIGSVVPSPSLLMDLTYNYHLIFVSQETFYRVVFDAQVQDLKLFTYQIQLENIQNVQVLDLDSVILTSSSGKIVLLSCPFSGDYVEEEINTYKMLDYLLPSNNGVIGSMASICWKENMILIGLEMEGRLRFWNLNRNVVLKNVVVSQTRHHGVNFHKYLQLFDLSKKNDSFDGDSAEFKLVVFYGNFYIYSASVSLAGEIKNLVLEMTIDISQKDLEEELVDFCVVHEKNQENRDLWMLWTLWNRAKTPVLRNFAISPGVAIPFGFSQRWTSGSSLKYWKEPLSLTDLKTEKSFEEQAFDYIFEASRFSFDTVSKALAYSSNQKVQDVRTWKELRNLAQESFKVNGDKKLDSPTSTSFVYSPLSPDFSLFLNTCYQYGMQESIPTCLYFNEELKMVVGRSNQSIIRLADPSEAILHDSPILIMASEGILKSWGWSDDISLKCVRSDIQHFNKISQLLEENISKDLIVSLDRYQVDFTLELMQKSLSDAILELRETYLQEICQSEALRICSSYFSCIENLELMFRVLLNVVTEGGLEPIKSQKSSTVASSAFYSAIAHTSMDLIATRHILCRNLLLTLLLGAQLKLNSGAAIIHSLIKETIIVFHCLSAIKRISEKRVEPTTDSTFVDRDASTLRFADNLDHASCSLFEHLIRHHYMSVLNNGEIFDSQTVTGLASLFIKSFGLIQKGRVLTTTDAVLVFANKMIAFGLHQVAISLLELFPNSPASSFLKGKVWLELNNYEESKNCFEKASAGIGIFFFRFNNSVDPLNNSDLSIVLASDVIKKGIVAYSQTVLDFFAEKKVPNMVIYFAKMALDCAPSNADPQQVQILKRIIFNQNLEIKGFDEAYAALITISDKERYNFYSYYSRMDCLRRFISCLCNNGDYDGIVHRYPFVNMNEEVEKTLDFKARTEPVLSFLQEKDRTNYFKILFRYHSFRRNFKKGNEIFKLNY